MHGLPANWSTLDRINCSTHHTRFTLYCRDYFRQKLIDVLAYDHCWLNECVGQLLPPTDRGSVDRALPRQWGGQIELPSLVDHNPMWLIIRRSNDLRACVL
jgi:hypothetical protein